MASVGSITVEARLTVTKETAAICLSLLSLYLDDNQDITIRCDTNVVDGERRHLLKFIDWPPAAKLDEGGQDD